MVPPAIVHKLMKYLFSIRASYLEMQEVYRSFIIQDEKVISVDISQLLLERIPDFFKEFKDIRFLSISWNSFDSLPAFIGDLQHLEELYASRNALTELPEEMIKLKKLRVLDLSYNHFTEIPPLLLKMKNLRYVSLKKNKIERKDFPLSKLKHIDGINLMGNPLQLHHKEDEFLHRRPFVIPKSFNFRNYVERKLILNGEDFTVLSLTRDNI